MRRAVALMRRAVALMRRAAALMLRAAAKMRRAKQSIQTDRYAKSGKPRQAHSIARSLESLEAVSCSAAFQR